MFNLENEDSWEPERSNLTWDSAEGPDRSTAETNVRAKLTKVAAGLPLPDMSGDEPTTTAACSWD